jgi:phage terminase large subunit-like protein
VVDVWEKPPDVLDWRVPIADVKQAIRDACRKYRVLEVAADPYRWAEQIQDLLDEGIPMVEFPTTAPSRMVPACAAFYDGVMTGELTHDADPRLLRHVRNAVVKRDRLGPRIVKDSKDSPRKIDLAVCAVVADERARWHAANNLEREPLAAWI